MITVNSSSDKNDNEIRFVCISDTHGKINFDIPDGDILIHAGDITRRGHMDEFRESFRWLASLPHKIKIITGGNHDHFLDETIGYIEQRQTLLALMESYNLLYLEHEIYHLPEEMGSFTLFVSPFSPMHLGGAFMLSDMSDIWKDVPRADILVTHTPPLGFGDKIMRGRHVGCYYLKKQMENVIKPKVHVFGHIHEASGYSFDDQGVLYVNACLSDHRYRPINKATVFDLPMNA